MNIISIVGKTNSGKTAVIEKIIPLLKNKGYKVGAIKHCAHDFEIDHPGKDSYRMTQGMSRYSCDCFIRKNGNTGKNLYNLKNLAEYVIQGKNE